VYVFCLQLHQKDPELVDPLDVDQWRFYVLGTRDMDEAVGDQKSIRLGPLLKLGPEEAEFGGILPAIRKLLG
jgi:hypothetical protein